MFAASGFWFSAAYVPQRRRTTVERWRRDLATHAEVRKDALQRFFVDGLADAESLAAYPSARHLLSPEAAVAPPPPAPSSAPLQEVFDGYVQSHGIAGVVLWDARGNVAARSLEFAVEPACAASARGVIASGVNTVEIHLHKSVEPMLTFSAPVRAADGNVRGVMVIAEDPRQWLYPFLSQALAGTKSGEALLVGRDGANAFYLTPLRSRPDPPLTFRRALDDPVFAARKALEGSEAVESSVDYRGVRVLAGGRRIPPTMWALVVKVDEAEAFAGVDVEIRRTGLALVGSLVALTLLVWGLSLKRQWDEDRARTESEARLAAFFDQANDAIVVTGPEGRVRFRNKACMALYGFPVEDPRGMVPPDFRPAESGDAARANLEELLRAGRIVFETEHQRADGSRFPAEVSARVVELGGEKLIVSVNRDITERKVAENRILHLNRLLKTIGEINQLIVHVADRKTLLGEACRVLVEHGGFRMVWIGFVDPRLSCVVPEARSGEGLTYLDGIEIRTDDTPEGRGPAGTAIRKAAHVFVANVETDASVAPWRQQMLENGFRAIASFPLKVRGEVTGVLTGYRSDLVPFSADETALLDELAGDLGYALEVLEIREESRRAEEALRTNAARLRSLFDGMLEGYAHCEMVFEGGEPADWVYLDVNPAFERLTGLKGVVGKRVTEVIPGIQETNSALFDVYGRVSATGEPAVFEEHVPALQHWFAVSAYSPRKGEFVAVFDDITERKNFEAALRESEEKFKYIFEHSVVAKSLTLPSGVVQTNGAFADMLGYSPEELREQTWKRLSHPDDEATSQEQVRALLAGEKESARFTKRYIHKNGSIVWGDVATSLRRDSAGQPLYFMTTVNDVTERKRAEEEIHLLNEQLEARVKERTRALEAANREMEAFSYSVSHDLRAPLRAMDGFSRILLEDHSEQLDTEGKRLLGVVRTNTVRMGDLIDDLLSFSRIGRQEMVRSEIDMEALAKAAFQELGPAGEPVSFTVGPLPRASGDPALLRQVFLNLISNALKFSAPKRNRTVEVGARTEPGRVVYWVKDNGVGFDMTYANQLFGVFQRLHSAAEFEGTGVGLALVRRIVQRHGGDAWAEGKVGEGATLWFSLPRAGGP